MVAQLVFEALDADRIDRVIGQHTRQEEAGEPAGRLRQDQERIAHRRGKEPLVPRDAITRAPGIVAIGHGLGRVGAHVRSALLLGHAHAHGERGFLREQRQARVVLRAGQAFVPVGPHGAIAPQGRRDGVAHRHRAEDGRLGLSKQHEARTTLYMRVARILARPGRGVQAVAQRGAHQRVVAGVELHHIGAVAKAVVRAQLGLVGVGQARVGQHLGRAHLGAERGEARHTQAGCMQAQRVLQRLVGGEQVHIRPRRALVEDVMGTRQGGGGQGHVGSFTGGRGEWSRGLRRRQPAFLSISTCGISSSRYSSDTASKPRLP